MTHGVSFNHAFRRVLGEDLYFLIRAPQKTPALPPTVLFVPPFAEERNRSRHLMSRTAEALAQAGISSIVFDLSGTGESHGEFRAATLTRWAEEIKAVAREMADQAGQTITLITIRAGFLFADTLWQAKDVVSGAVTWAPVLDGALHMKQFLRVRHAQLKERAAQSGQPAPPVSSLIDRLRDEGWLECAGYPLSDTLYQEFNGKRTPQPPQFPLLVLDPVREALPDALLSSERSVAFRHIDEPAFWQNAEPSDNPSLVAETVAWVVNHHRLTGRS